MARIDDPHVVRSTRQLELMRSPLRLRILGAMAELGACSAGDLARHLGVDADRLYYHVHRLVTGGLMVRDGRRPAVRRPETLYRLIKPAVIVDPDARSVPYVAKLGKVYSTAIRAADRAVNRALHAERRRPQGQLRRTAVVQNYARLSAEAYQRVRQMLMDVQDLMDRHDDPAQAEYMVTAVLTPVVARRR